MNRRPIDLVLEIRHVSSADRTIKLWDAETGEEIETLRGHTDWVRDVIFSHDGCDIVSCSDDQTIKVWEASTGNELATIRGHTGRILSIALSPNDASIGSAAASSLEHTPAGHVKLWSFWRQPEATTFHDHNCEVRSVAISPNGHYFASCGTSFTTAHPSDVIVRDIKSQRIVCRLPAEQGSLGYTAVCFSAVNDLATKGRFGLTFYQIPTGRKLLHISNNIYNHWGALALNDTLVAAHGTTVWEMNTGKKLFQMTGHMISSNVTALAFSPDGELFASANWGCYLRRSDPMETMLHQATPMDPSKFGIFPTERWIVSLRDIPAKLQVLSTIRTEQESRRPAMIILSRSGMSLMHRKW